MATKPIGEFEATQGSDKQRITTRILERLAEQAQTDHLNFETPLYNVIDPDALETFIHRADEDARIEFTYLGYRIRARGDGHVTVTDRDD